MFIEIPNFVRKNYAKPQLASANQKFLYFFFVEICHFLQKIIKN